MLGPTFLPFSAAVVPAQDSGGDERTKPREYDYTQHPYYVTFSGKSFSFCYTFASFRVKPIPLEDIRRVLKSADYKQSYTNCAGKFYSKCLFKADDSSTVIKDSKSNSAVIGLRSEMILITNQATMKDFASSQFVIGKYDNSIDVQDELLLMSLITGNNF